MLSQMGIRRKLEYVTARPALAGGCLPRGGVGGLAQNSSYGIDQ